MKLAESRERIIQLEHRLRQFEQSTDQQQEQQQQPPPLPPKSSKSDK